MLVYGVTALLCMNAAMGKNFRLGNITVIVFSVVWMVLLIPQLVEWMVGGMSSVTDQKKHSSVQMEFVREFFGLSLTIFTMIFHLRSSRSADKLL